VRREVPVRRTVFTCFVAATVLGCSSPASADVINVTAGQASLHLFDFGSFSLEGPGTSLFYDSLSSFSSTSLTPGDTVRFGGSITPSGRPPHSVSATVNGITFNGVFLSGQLTFETDPFLVPAATSDFLSVSVPLSLSGFLTGHDGPFGEGRERFSANVRGGGTFHEAFQKIDLANGQSAWFNSLGSASLTFAAADQGAATPEPGTLFMLGTAVAGMFGRRLRRRCQG
jgi:hypothetical protein